MNIQVTTNEKTKLSEKTKTKRGKLEQQKGSPKFFRHFPYVTSFDKYDVLFVSSFLYCRVLLSPFFFPSSLVPLHNPL